MTGALASTGSGSGDPAEPDDTAGAPPDPDGRHRRSPYLDRAGWPLVARVVAGLAATALVWLVVDAVLDRGAPPGIVLRGLVIGGLYALGAIGIVLVWRGSGIVNFAQVELGSVAAVLAITFVVRGGMNYFLAVALGLAIAAAMGWLVDALVIRRFRKAPRLILTVATIGVAQVLAGLAILIPLLFSGISSGRFTTPFSFRFTVEPVTFDGNYLVVLVVVPAVLLGLGAFLRSTDYGVAIRAASENDDRASLLGVPTRRLSAMVWAVAALLSATAVMLRVPLLGFASFANVSGGGNALLLRLLAAAVIGRMDNLPRTVVAALGIGVFEELASSEFANTNVVDALLVAVILVALLAQRDAFRRAVETGISSWRAVREVRPVPAELRHLPEVRWGGRFLQVALLVGAITVPLWSRPSQQQAAALLLIYAIVAISLLVLTGWAGQISLGQFALVGIGGAASGVLYDRHGWDFLLAVPAGMVAAALVAVGIGIPALRVRGPFLAVTTLAFAVTASTFFLNEQYFAWFVPKGVEPPVIWGRVDLGARWVQYEVCLAALLLAIVAARNLRASRVGRTLIAVRDNEPASATMTLDPTRAKLLAFGISGAFAGFAGSLYVVTQGGIFADAFDAEVSIRLFSMVVIGGLSTIPGVVLGAVYVRGAEFFLPAQWSLIASGMGILLLLLILPEGLGGGLYRIRDAILRAIARRRGLLVPSLLEDRRLVDGAPAPPSTSDERPARPISTPAGRADPTDHHRGAPLLSIESIDVSYGQTQVLFGVDLEVAEGEIVALLGTNGAGKSTVLRAVSGLTPPSAGRITFDGADITATDARTTSGLGIAQVPGGRGVFPSLTVADNLRVAGWSRRADRTGLQAATEQCLDWFPALRSRWHTAAGDLSGGEQQMLSLAQAFLARPKLLMIDELSLGLAPTVVERLLEIVRAIHAQGTTIVLVEQSVQVALRLAERAIFLEKGEVRFEGPTADLLERGDILRAVYLKGTRATSAGPAGRRSPARAPANITRSGPPDGAEVVLRAEHATKRYGGVTAVDDVTFSLHEGELLGVIGPNGAGKTTLFDLLTGFTPLDRGRVVLGDRDVTGLPAHARARLGLGRTFQDARLWPSLTVRECLAVSCERTTEARDPISAVLAVPAQRAAEAAVALRVDELIELVGVQAFADKFVGELSTGSRRMVEIGCLLGNGARTLLLDEPSSGIAQKETEALGPVLLDVREQLRASIVLIEHDMVLLTSVADRLLALDTGAVVTTGAADDVLSHPRVVAAYLGEPAPS